ncbi:MAG: acyltransferase [Cyanobacteria bacterium P01_D01_bin.56]
MKQVSKKMQQLELLACLRGIAALLIVAFHATELFRLKFGQPFLRSLFEFGDSGVDFFFVLSGFFLALSSFKYIGRQHTAGEFLIKRCVRIYPFYWLVSIGIIPVYFLMPSFGKGHETEVGVIIKSLLLIPQSHAPIVSVAWFLSHLVFFYFIFTAVILLPRVFTNVVFAGLSLTVFFRVVDVIPGLQLGETSHYLIDFVFSFYNLEFAAGCLLGVFFKRMQLRASLSLLMLLVGCLTFMVAGLLDVYILQTSANASSLSHYYEFVAYGLSSVLIVGGAAFLEKCRRVSIHQWFVALGAASFSIYLTHYPILSIMTKGIQVMGISGTGFRTAGMVLACVMAVLVGCIVHFYIENKLVALFRKNLAYKRA